MNNKKLKGFTLVELIIVIGLMSVLMVMVGLILKPISQVFSDTASYTKDRQVMDGIAQYLDESIKYADNIIVIYDKDYMTLKDSDFGAYIATLMNKDYISMSTADKEAYSKRIQGIAIINDCSGNCTS
ncbi:MAG: type II secretion system protein, partial [Oscillospiraceae bacterium]|nr:type II secretion system protein [Oscillospiraceae bacterium]